MIEVNLTYDLLPGIDQQAYGEWGKKAVEKLLQAPGIIEFRGNRNVLGSPQVRSISVWQTLADWARHLESAEWQALESELRAFGSNLKVEIWGPSPVIPDPIRPGK